MDSTLLIGMVLALIGYTVINLGLVLEKKGLDSQSKILETSFSSNVSNFLSNKTWLLGFLGTVVGTLVSYVALVFAPITVIQVFLGVGLCFLALFSFFLLNEKLSKFELLGIGIIVVGVALLSSIANTFETAENDLEALKSLINSEESIFFVTLLTFAQIFLWFTGKKKRNVITGINFGLISGVSAGLAQLYMKGIIGGLNDYLKSPSELTYLMWLLLMVVFLTISFLTLQMGFQYAAATHVAPLFNISALIIPVIGGGVIYKEWSTLSTNETIIAITSLCIVSIGVFLLSVMSNLKETKASLEDETGN
ncbi:MAG: DMT family transporter [Candidatus Kariarchaeaceae archaeon]